MPTPPAEYVDAIDHLPAGSALVIPDVSWPDYEALLAQLGDGYAVRVSYDDGRLEIVTPSARHEKIKEFILAIARVLASELGTALETFGSTTFKTKALRQGAEPDTCFYVEHAGLVVGRDELDLAVDPPPDVIVEVDLSHSSTRKMTFYAQIGVPELWRYDGRRVVIYRLGGTSYHETPSSVAFAPVTADTLTAIIRRIDTEGQQTVLEAFRKSLRA